MVANGYPKPCHCEEGIARRGNLQQSSYILQKTD